MQMAGRYLSRESGLTPQFAVPSLERLLEHPAFEVLAVVTQPDKRRVAAIKQCLHR